VQTFHATWTPDRNQGPCIAVENQESSGAYCSIGLEICQTLRVSCHVGEKAL
jgi:hypothetical protein